ncbi:MAG: hypothetical protein AAGE43_20895, partial [Pseudomonadota bacterium]
FALIYLAYSVSKPFREESDFSSADYPEAGYEDAEFDDDYLYGGGGGTGQDAPDPDWSPRQSVLSGTLIWNTTPARDPFTNKTPVQTASGAPIPVALAPVPNVPRLDALVVGPDSVLAVLDDRIVRVGDRHGDFRVTGISRKGVRISAANESVWLPVPGRGIGNHKPELAEAGGGDSSGE